jgi:hypothetical protein
MNVDPFVLFVDLIQDFRMGRMHKEPESVDAQLAEFWRDSTHMTTQSTALKGGRSIRICGPQAWERYRHLNPGKATGATSRVSDAFAPARR